VGEGLDPATGNESESMYSLVGIDAFNSDASTDASLLKIHC